MSATVVHAPNVIPFNNRRPKIFLAGSIEMGTAEDWQARMIKGLEDLECDIFNPRRPDWDSSWVQEKSNPKFAEQVNWELNHLARADIIAFFFAPGTVSPISMLEFGLHAYGRVIVCCPPGFSRKGNIDIVAERTGVPVYESFGEFLLAVRNAIKSENMWL